MGISVNKLNKWLDREPAWTAVVAYIEGIYTCLLIVSVIIFIRIFVHSDCWWGIFCFKVEDVRKQFVTFDFEDSFLFPIVFSLFYFAHYEDIIAARSAWGLIDW